MQVGFTRRPDNGTVAEFTRADGVRMRVRSYDRTGLVPHDAAHLLIERAFRLSHGFWGCVSEGALFASVEVVEGRTRHDHRARSATLIRNHVPDLNLAERVVGTVLAALGSPTPPAARDLAAIWSLTTLAPPPDPAAVACTALADLRELQDRWAGLRTGDTFELAWAAPTGRRRGSGRSTR